MSCDVSAVGMSGCGACNIRTRLGKAVDFALRFRFVH